MAESINKKIAIIIVSYNAKYMMIENIESIRKTLIKDTYHIYIIDNASTDGIAEWLMEESAKCDDLSVECNSENIGFPAACNQGYELMLKKGDADSDIFLLNNDTRLCNNSLANLIEALYSSENIGATGSISNYAGNNQQLDINFSLPADYVEFGDKNNSSFDELENGIKWEERVRLSGFAMLIKRSVWDAVGGMDERFTPGYFEDDDLSMKIHKLGKKLLLCNNSFIYHAGSQSFSKLDTVEDLLLNNYSVFVNKYGFEVLDYIYADENELAKIKYDANDKFTFLNIECGLGANIKYINSKYQNSHTLGIESNDVLLDIASSTEKVYRNIADLLSEYPDAIFDVIYAREEDLAKLSEDEIQLIVSRCAENCLIIPNNDIDFSKVKLVIWDMDNTFWEGILAEGEINPIPDNIALVKKLVDNGIMCSVSSKNNADDVNRMLEELGVADYFVFNSINYDEKGDQIKTKLSDMNLRAENTLFIDDEIRNLEEADYVNEGIIASDPMIIPELFSYAMSLADTDIKHKRLNQYKILEKKRTEEKTTSSKEQFLIDSEIYIDISADCATEVDRIAELVARSNQLNFTKVRDPKETISSLLTDNHVEKGVIRAKDKFGDYGLIGFYCFNNDGSLRHFLFSCRVLGMGIEQKIYSMLGFPDFDVVGDVAVKLNKTETCSYIKTNLDEYLNDENNSNSENGIKILLKGPCDLSAVGSYLQGGNITSDFNYVNDLGFITTGQNHSAHIVESHKLSDNVIKESIKNVPFITEGDFKTSIFDNEYDIICYSLLPDCQAGLYEHKNSGFRVAFGSKNFDLTDRKNMSGYIDGTIQNHGFEFSEYIINEFANEYKFIEYTPVEDIISNIEYIYNNVIGNPEIILFLGSEIEYEGYNPEFANLVERHKTVNAAVREFAKGKERIRCIDTTSYIKSQDDYIDCINHFSRNVYYDIATDVVKCINDRVAELSKPKEPYEYDALIMTVPNDYLRLEHLYNRVVNHMPAKRVRFIGNSEVGSLVDKSNLGYRLTFTDENEILSFGEVHAVMKDALKDILNGQELPRGITGWYYQQFLKMAYSKICKDKYYLVWDGDTVPCKNFSMFKDGTDKPYFDLKTEYHEEYFITMAKLIPGMGKVIGKSFISEHMLINAEYMKELIAVIESNSNIKGDKFFEKIIYAIEPEKLMSNSFSEFETYGTYVALKHMEAYMLRSWHSFRYGGDFFDSKKIDDDDFLWLSKDFDAISFEKGHEVREDHKNLFDNKEYQAKLSARQMLEVAQQEFQGDSFIESWEPLAKNSTDNSETEDTRKRILFCIGINELVENNDIIVNAVSDRLKTFAESSDKICCTVKFFPEDMTQWRNIDLLKTDILVRKTEKFMNLGISDDMIIENHDAYYGSPTPYVYQFIQKEKPVMIWNAEVNANE